MTNNKRALLVIVLVLGLALAAILALDTAWCVENYPLGRVPHCLHYENSIYGRFIQPQTAALSCADLRANIERLTAEVDRLAAEQSLATEILSQMSIEARRAEANMIKLGAALKDLHPQ